MSVLDQVRRDDDIWGCPLAHPPKCFRPIKVYGCDVIKRFQKFRSQWVGQIISIMETTDIHSTVQADAPETKLRCRWTFQKGWSLALTPAFQSVRLFTTADRERGEGDGGGGERGRRELLHLSQTFVYVQPTSFRPLYISVNSVWIKQSASVRIKPTFALQRRVLPEDTVNRSKRRVGPKDRMEAGILQGPINTFFGSTPCFFFVLFW